MHDLCAWLTVFLALGILASEAPVAVAAGQPGDTADDPGDRDGVRGSGLARADGRPRPARAERGEPGHHRRDRNRQGAGRPLHPRAQHAQGRTLRRRQLRRARRQPGRGRAVRLREGRLHRRAEGRRSAGSRRRTAARSSSTRSATCRSRCQVKLLRVLQEREVVRLGARSPVPVDVRVHCRHQYRPRSGGRRRPVPAGPVLPPERRHRPAAAAPRAARRHPARSPRISSALSHAHEPAGPRPRRGGAGRARRAIRGRATSASWRTSFTTRCCSPPDRGSSRPTSGSSARLPAPAATGRPVRSKPQGGGGAADRVRRAGSLRSASPASW